MNLNWIFVHLLSSVGFILALAFLSHILKERRSPTSTLAWLMAIIFIPYIGVPLYLMLGGRKMINKVGTKPALATETSAPCASADICDVPLFEHGNGIFPPSAHNHVTLMPEGEHVFQAIIALIRNSRHTIYIATFILGKDDTGRAIVDALAQKASQGVKVFLLLDALGSVRISRRFLSPLLRAGGAVAFFMPMIHWPFRGRANLRNHRKMIICDHETALIGGMNLASPYMGPRSSGDQWQDLSLLVRGPVVDHITDIFRSDWAFAAGSTLDRDSMDGESSAPNSGGVAQLIASGPDVRTDTLRNEILTSIFQAKQRIWVVTPYFIPDEFLLEALYIAGHRGVDVSVLVPRKSNHRLADLVREGYLSRIQEAGAGVWLYEPRMLHAKAILVDNSLAIVGSANMDMRSLLLNYEVALCLYDADLVGQLEDWMLELRKDSSRRQLQTEGAFDLLKGMGRLLAPLL